MRRPILLTTTAAVAAVALARPRTSAAQDSVRPLSRGRVAAQAAFGTVTTPVAFFGSGMLTKRVARGLGASDERASQLAYVGAWSGAALATAAVPAAIGARGPGRGSYAAALGGAVAGGLGSWGLVRLTSREDGESRGPCRIRCTLVTVAVFALPSIGATVAYDASRHAAR